MPNYFSEVLLFPLSNLSSDISWLLSFNLYSYTFLGFVTSATFLFSPILDFNNPSFICYLFYKLVGLFFLLGEAELDILPLALRVFPDDLVIFG